MKLKEYGSIMNDKCSIPAVLLEEFAYSVIKMCDLAFKYGIMVKSFVSKEIHLREVYTFFLVLQFLQLE